MLLNKNKKKILLSFLRSNNFFFALPLTFFASSSASFSLTGVAVNISDRRFFFPFWFPFLRPAFGIGRTLVGLNCGLTVEQHGSSAKASGLMQITVVSTTREVLRASESSQGFMFKSLELASKHSLEHEGLVCDKAIGSKATPSKFRFVATTGDWLGQEYEECVL